MKIHKKIGLIFLSIVLLFSLTGVSCGSGSKSVSKNREATLTVWRLFDDKEVFDPIVKAYNGISGNEKINVVYIKKDYNEYVTDTVNAIAAGKGPDIWMIRNDWVTKQADKLIPAPTTIVTLDDYKKQFPDIAINDNVIDGKIYGLPLSIDTLVLYLNKDIFQAKVSELAQQEKESDMQLLISKPANWEEFTKTVQLLTKKNGNDIEQAGVALGTANNIDRLTDIITAMMLQTGTKMVSDNKQSATFNLPIVKSTGGQTYSGIEALNLYKSFADLSSSNYTWNSSMPNSVEAFMQGKTAMLIDYGFVRSTFKQKVPNLNYDVVPLPQIKDAATAVDFPSYWVETVTNNCKNPDIAWDFIKFVNDNLATTYQQATNRPSNNRINTNSIPIVKNRVLYASTVFDFQLASAQDWYKGYYPEKVDEVFKTMLENITEKGQDAQHSIDKAASDVTTLLLKKPY